MVAFGVAFPIYMNPVLGIRQVDPKPLEVGRVAGLSMIVLVVVVVVDAVARLLERRLLAWHPNQLCSGEVSSTAVSVIGLQRSFGDRRVIRSLDSQTERREFVAR